MTQNEIGQVITQRIKEKGTNKTALARKLGISFNTVKAMCNGNIGQHSQLHKVCNELEIDIEAIVNVKES